ncbi:MAG TPA: sialate O-acetylesterase [Candidatus Acidoferrum sp.]|nr:sialate O-acetylesterase [Candidatus Acidoferrum sp.]
MRTFHSKLTLAFALVVTTVASACAAETSSLPLVSLVFGDHMALQRGKPNTIWGWAKPGEAIRVEMAGHSANAVCAADGRWQVKLDPPAPGGPYTLTIDGPQHLDLHDVLVGDVWLCGGQSNMELGLTRTRNGAEEIKAANHPEIRLYKVQSHPAYSPSTVPQGRWKVCTPQTITEDGGFSAVAYFFARRLRQDVSVPVGLIEDCLGGTPAESWTSPQALHTLKDFDAQLAEVERLKARGGPQYGNYIMHWYDEYDLGQKSNTWAAATLDDSAWKTVSIPGGFKELGVADVPSVCWFRKEITLPDPLPAGSATLFLGVIEKMDTAYVNGQWVGASAWVENPRVYHIREGVLKPGRNIVAVRVFKLKSEGGFMSKPETLRLALGDKTVVPLAGEWRGALSVDARPPHPLPLTFENWPVMPSVLYYGMLQPLAPLAITGAIWYQGEANSERAYQYRTLLPAMIADWRKLLGQGEFPFYIVSLPAFMHHQDQPTESNWAELREAQALTARHVPHCGLAVTIDIGDPDNIHPADKKIVGERLALCALAEHYGKNTPYQGPTYKSLRRLPGALELRFDHADGGLVVKGDKPAEFSVAGKDRKWHWAEARIQGDVIVVSSSEVPEPEAARYAWQSFPTATLYNGAGLPAVPFRTDTWPLTTEPRQVTGANQ